MASPLFKYAHPAEAAAAAGAETLAWWVVTAGLNSPATCAALGLSHLAGLAAYTRWGPRMAASELQLHAVVMAVAIFAVGLGGLLPPVVTLAAAGLALGVHSPFVALACLPPAQGSVAWALVEHVGGPVALLVVLASGGSGPYRAAGLGLTAVTVHVLLAAGFYFGLLPKAEEPAPPPSDHDVRPRPAAERAALVAGAVLAVCRGAIQLFLFMSALKWGYSPGAWTTGAAVSWVAATVAGTWAIERALPPYSRALALDAAPLVAVLMTLGVDAGSLIWVGDSAPALAAGVAAAVAVLPATGLARRALLELRAAGSLGASALAPGSVWLASDRVCEGLGWLLAYVCWTTLRLSPMAPVSVLLFLARWLVVAGTDPVLSVISNVAVSSPTAADPSREGGEEEEDAFDATSDGEDMPLDDSADEEEVNLQREDEAGVRA